MNNEINTESLDSVLIPFSGRSSSGVNAAEPPAGEPDEDHRIAAHHGEAGPWGQGVCDPERSVEQHCTGVGRQVRREVVRQRGGQQLGQRWDHEEHRNEGGDRGGCVPEQRPQRDGRQAGHGQIQRRTQDRTQRDRVGQGSVQVLPAQQRLATKNDVKLAASMVTNTVPANTASLPHNIGSRLGTTVNDERIIPVLYSPVISSTPRTPTASWARNVPVSDVEMAVAPGSKPVDWLAMMAANIAPNPIINTTAISRVDTVERSERNLVHSDNRTRAWVTRIELPPLVVAGVVTRAKVVVMPPPPRCLLLRCLLLRCLLLRCRCCRWSGIRRSRWSVS